MRVKVRAGIPRVAGLLRAAQPVTVVAFGTSMTLSGQYLDGAPSALRSIAGSDAVRFVNRGLGGFVTFTAPFRVADAVLPERPDLILMEFAHNDVEPSAVEAIGEALEGVLAQVWTALPGCEFAFVYLAQPGHARNGPPPAVQHYEAVADRHGIASIDCTAFVEGLVERGEATWSGGERSLTVDGIHHAEIARELIGRPFAQALLELIDASRGPYADRYAEPGVRFAETQQRAARTFVNGGQWSVDVPADHATRLADAYVDGSVLQSVAHGGSLSIPFDGDFLLVWASGTGAIDFDLDVENVAPYRSVREFTEPRAWHPLVLRLPARAHATATIRIRNGAVRFGDVYVAGAFR